MLGILFAELRSIYTLMIIFTSFSYLSPTIIRPLFQSSYQYC